MNTIVTKNIDYFSCGLVASKKTIAFTTFFASILIFSVLHTALAYGVQNNEIPEMQSIQEQLTQEYLNTNQKALGLRILEEKILDAKIENLTLEDSIYDLETDMATLQEDITNLFDQLAVPRAELKEVQEEKVKITKAMKSQIHVLLEVYTKLTFSSDRQKNNDMQAFFAMMDDKNVAINDQLESLALREVEKKSISSYLSLSEQLSEVLAQEKNIILRIEQKEEKFHELTNRRDSMQQNKELKEVLLAQSQEEKEGFDELLDTSRVQMLQSQMDAVSIDDSLDALNKKIAELEEEALRKEQGEAIETAERVSQIKDEYSADELTNELIASIDIQQLQDAQAIVKAPLSWPIDPSRGITATFRDSEYYQMFKMHHNAIDIRAYQGTDVYSAADGYVYKSVDNGLGYSYIIILHRNNLRTVYGHMSSLGVRAGQMVTEGQYIGKSGGMPGTKGAGKMTTGPHLHFEVLDNEVYKDPIEYLEAGRL